MNYTITVPATGTYDLSARVACAGPGGTFHVEFAGVDKIVDKTGAIVIPDTGAWQKYTTVVGGGVALTAGTYAMRVVIDADGRYGFGGNLNWFKLAAVGTGAAAPPEQPRNLLF